MITVTPFIFFEDNCCYKHIIDSQNIWSNTTHKLNRVLYYPYQHFHWTVSYKLYVFHSYSFFKRNVNRLKLGKKFDIMFCVTLFTLNMDILTAITSLWNCISKGHYLVVSWSCFENHISNWDVFIYQNPFFQHKRYTDPNKKRRVSLLKLFFGNCYSSLPHDV